MDVTSARSHRDLTEAYGFVPNLFVCAMGLPRVVEAAESLIGAILVQESKLSRQQKDGLMRTVAGVWDNDYCLALHNERLPADSDLFRFSQKLAQHTPWFSRRDVDALKANGFEEAAILEVVVVVALGQFLCTLARALRPGIDPNCSPPAPEDPLAPKSYEWMPTSGPYFPFPNQATDARSHTFLRDQLGFVPNLFKQQMVRPDLVDAEVQAVERIMTPDDMLNPVQKGNILLAISAANLDTYSISLHTQMLGILGVPPEDSDQIVDDYHQSAISAADKALLDEVRKLACPYAGTLADFQVESLRAAGFTEAQIIEAVAMAAFSNFLNTLQAGLGAVPDFPPRRVLTPKDLYLSSGQSRPISDVNLPADPDAALVAQVQGGHTDAFEELVRKHSRRIFGTLAGLIGNVDEARDATQDVFLKAFENIGRFQGRSKFSTWLTSIAINTGTEVLRQRKPSEPLETGEEDEDFRPRQVQSWAETPEQILTTSERRNLVKEGVLRLPHKYRVVILLRDINQFSTDDAAAALGLSIPALKARLLRGRLMLRESLAPHFLPIERTRDAQLR